MIHLRHYHTIREKIFISSAGSRLYLGHILAILLLLIYPIAVEQLRLPLFTITLSLAAFILYSMILPEKPDWKILITGAVTVMYILYYAEAHLSYTSYHFLAKSVFLFLFSVFMFSSMLVETMKSEISLRLLYQSIDCYLFLGICFSFAFRIIHFSDPASFNFELRQEFNHIYLSFVILTTVGLGDLVPKTLPAKALVILNGILGQIYIAFFAAMIVGKYLTKTR